MMTRKQAKCWARALGGCQGGQSLEHYLTKGLYPGNVKAVGLPWAKGKPVDLPITSLRANILCKHHNEALSDIDGEAIRMKDFVAQAIDSLSKKNARFSQMHYCSVDGSKIMRWFSKTICNLETLAKRTPDKVYVRHAFGQANAPVHVYMDKVFPTENDADASHFRFWWWPVDLKAGGSTTVYIVRFAILEWLIAPFALTPDKCDAIGQLTDTRYWFKAKPIVRTRIIPMGQSLPCNKTTWTHQLTFRISKRRR